MASDARSVSDSRVGADAAADAGRARRATLSRLPRSLPDAVRRRAIVAAARPRGVGWARLLCPRTQSPPAGTTGNSQRPRAERHAPSGSGRVARAPGHWPIHGRGRSVVRLRAACPAGRHERRPRPAARLRSRRESQIDAGATRALGSGGGASAPLRARRVDTQSSAHGAWRARVHGAAATMPALPGARRVSERGAPRRTPDYLRGIFGTCGIFSVSLLLYGRSA